MATSFVYNKNFQLESGHIIPRLHLAYTQLGELNAAGDNVVWVFHALTANSDPAEWWNGLVGEGRLIDPAVYCIICVNMPGSCYGSISPLDIDPDHGEPYFHAFPWFTTRDMVRAYQQLRDELGIRKVKLGIGGSMGGQQLLEWAIDEPSFFESIVPIATNAKHSPWGIAFNTSQRMAIAADPSWKLSAPDAGLNGLKVARSIALLSYRHYEAYGATQQGSVTVDGEEVYRASTYQQYQGEKLAARFNAFSYVALTKGMDSHDLGRNRQSLTQALQQISARTLVIGISSDLLFPPSEQQFLADHIPNAAFALIDSDYGHDGFLLEFDAIRLLVSPLLENRKELITLND